MCLNGGICQNVGGTATCFCIDGYYGDRCQCESSAFIFFSSFILIKAFLNPNATAKKLLSAPIEWDMRQS